MIATECIMVDRVWRDCARSITRAAFGIEDMLLALWTVGEKALLSL
jgi:hypothetical protein